MNTLVLTVYCVRQQMFVNHSRHPSDTVHKTHWTYLQGMYSLMETSPWVPFQCGALVYVERHQGCLSIS